MADRVGSSDDIGSVDEPDDGSRKARGRKKKKGSFWRELPLLILTALVLTFLIQTFLGRVYIIPSASMEPTLHGCSGCANDRVLVDKVTYRFTDPSPGDVVVFRGPESWGTSLEATSTRSDNPLIRALQQVGAVIGLAPPDERDFVKRVIAVGGQTVECCDDQNRVMVDGEPLHEHHLYLVDGQPQEEFGPVTVPEGHLWMMGDNRNNSADSRRHIDDAHSGAVPLENVIGKARLIVLPPSRWQVIDDENPQQTATAMPASSGGVLAEAPSGVPQATLPAGAALLLALPLNRTLERGGRALYTRLTDLRWPGRRVRARRRR